jgi:hypothetical protein
MSIEDLGGALVLAVDGEPRFRLVPLGGNEFRFAGWTMERMIEIGDDQVTLRTRRGDSESWTRRLPAQRLDAQEAVS